jgi:hypothetical protein
MAGGQITTAHDDPTVSVFRGVSIDSDAKFENDSDLIRSDREYHSKAIDANNSHP